MFGYGAQWGYTTDPETGLLLLTNRYYDPGTARFLTRDPLGQAGGLNLYGYCGNNPSSYADPLGLVSRDQYVANGEAFGGALGITVGTESTVVGGVVLATALGGYFGNVGGSLYDSGEDFGFAVGCYEGGQATLGQVVWSGFKGSVNVASNALFLAGVFAPALAPPAGDFASQMTPEEATRYNKYWQRYSPKQVGPGPRRVQWRRISGRTGRVEDSTVIYDEYGRQRWRVDWTDHLRPEAHTDPHLHETQWGPAYHRVNGREILHNLR